MAAAIPDIVKVLGNPGTLALLVLLAASAFVCFMGYSHFRFSAGFAGLLVGMELAGQLAMRQDWGRAGTAIAGVLGGAALATLFAVFTFLGTFGFGALLAVTAVGGAAGSARQALEPLETVLAGLIGGFGGMALRRFVAIVATSLYGGLLSIAALFALVRRRSLAAAFELMGGPSGRAELVTFLLCVAVLVTGGLVAQFRYGKNPRVDGGRSREGFP